MEPHFTAVGCHLPYGVTQWYLPPNTRNTPCFNASQPGAQFTYPRGMGSL